jgi:hypothetical protein
VAVVEGQHVPLRHPVPVELVVVVTVAVMSPVIQLQLEQLILAEEAVAVVSLQTSVKAVALVSSS